VGRLLRTLREDCERWLEEDDWLSKIEF